MSDNAAANVDQLPDPSSEGTSAVWVRALQDDPQHANTAMAHLERRYLMRLRVFVAHKLGPAMRQRHDPDEIINDAWWRAVKSIDHFEYRHRGSFLDWLRKQVQWVILDLHRADRGRPDAVPIGGSGDDSQVTPATDPSDHGAGPLTEAGRKDVRDKLVRSLEAVPEIYRRVLERYCLQEWDRQRIADDLGIKANTVSQQLKRGLEHWKRVLGEDPTRYV